MSDYFDIDRCDLNVNKLCISLGVSFAIEGCLNVNDRLISLNGVSLEVGECFDLYTGGALPLMELPVTTLR
ncbi:hypothetical protein NDU88_001296 [Pleurodeles waltl]|uniref:PDZ domain-containing protein n=1 Tax=Pleurodeles waltl TaxID=8319 RepID=A0AAV7T043_PLEWA|nr:hypothetical protein NDU88_001296 [Pleurodeles waltl]